MSEYGEWISVNDRLPEVSAGLLNSTSVLVCWGTPVVVCMDYQRDFVRGKEVCRFHWHTNLSPWKITHWMPLPKAPRRGGKA